MNNQKYILLFHLILFLVCCHSEQPSSDQEEVTNSTASLHCTFDSTNQQYGLFLIIDHLTIKLADLPTCEIIAAPDYQNHQIPDSARFAAISWHAGTYFFLTQNEQTVRIHRALMGDIQDSPPLFFPYALYKSGKFSFHRPK